MLCISGETNTLKGAVLYEPQQIAATELAAGQQLAFPWRGLEFGIAVALILVVSILPVATVGTVEFTKSVTIWSALGFLMDMISIGSGSHTALIITAALFTLLGVGFGTMADTAVSCVDETKRGKRIGASWGMVAFGIGVVALGQLAGQQVSYCGFDFTVLHVGPAVWASVIGGLACAVIDFIRSEMDE